MISYLSGTVFSCEEDAVTLLVGGVGYEIHCPIRSVFSLEIGSQKSLYIYTHVREDALQLFGFEDRKEKQTFLSLIKVNGIGPKLALNILSAAPYEKIWGWIESGDVKALTKLPKIGKKTAEQLVLTLKGQLIFESETLGASTHSLREIKSALTHLGFKASEVDQAVSKLDVSVSVEEGVRKCLGLLTHGAEV